MADTVCSMCGDVGFPDKLFQCMRCLSRFQHSYCSNYYEEKPSEVCDWCLTEDRRHGQASSSKMKHTPAGDKAKRSSSTDTTQESVSTRAKSSASSSSSSKPAARRYKLLKDVLC